jgi:hypothetical protein
MRALPASDGAFYLNGVSHPRKSLKTMRSDRAKKAKVGDRERLADWHGRDGYRGCVVFIFLRTLSRRAAEHLGLRYPALEPAVYGPSSASAADQYHPDAIIAARAIDMAGSAR